MTQDAATIARMRRMVAEPTETPYTDAIITAYIEEYPVMDSEGYEPDEDGWTAIYDLNAAAADIWDEKASSVQKYYNFQADGAQYSQSDLFEMAMEKVRYYRARSKSSSRYTHKAPKEINTGDNPAEDGLIYDETYAWWRL